MGARDLRANLNQGLLKFKNKSRFCNNNNKDRTAVRTSQSVDNPIKFYFCCSKPMDDRQRCKFFQFWLPRKIINLESDLTETMEEVWQKLDNLEMLV